MAAPGVQLNSEIHLSCFQPTVDQYLKKIEQAITTEDKTTAEQALSQLQKAASAPGAAGGSADGRNTSGMITVGLNYLRAALDSNDFSSAGQALNTLKKDLASGQGSDASEAGNLTDLSGADSSSVNPDQQESGGNISVKA
jgi:hypothetical protein